MNIRQRIFAVQLVLLLLIAGNATADDRRWYDVSAQDKSIAEQVISISMIGVHVDVMFQDMDFWHLPALHNVHGWFTPQQAFCLALSGTPMEPVLLPEGNFAFHRYGEFPDTSEHCEYVTPDWGPEWIHPPQADWR